MRSSSWPISKIPLDGQFLYDYDVANVNWISRMLDGVGVTTGANDPFGATATVVVIP